MSDGQSAVTKNTRSGAIVFNDVNLHVGTPGLPFGGVGGSGCMSV
jgi:acyl-CoA reductase-like NAD-dependent aldehyde dehydrogenase